MTDSNGDHDFSNSGTLLDAFKAEDVLEESNSSDKNEDFLPESQDECGDDDLIDGPEDQEQKPAQGEPVENDLVDEPEGQQPEDQQQVAQLSADMITEYSLNGEDKVAAGERLFPILSGWVSKEDLKNSSE